MEITLQILILLMVIAATVTITTLLASLRCNRHLHRLEQEKSDLDAQFREAQTRYDLYREMSESSQQQLKESFNALAADALRANSSEFIKLAQSQFKQFQTHAQSELGEREKAVENLVKPIREAMDRAEKQLHSVEKERREAYGSLSKHLDTMADLHRTLHTETHNLTQALRRPEVRGQWGEITLKRLAELAGMVEHCDFEEQLQVHSDEGGRQRPDMVVHMPNRRDIIIDAKTPLDSYLSAIEAKDDEDRQAALQKHARNVRNRVRELAAKSYWQQFENSPDFVVLFIPGEQFLSTALEMDPKLLEEALAERVILATPTSLVALLRAIAYGWRQEQLAENAEQIRSIGADLYNRLATFSDHLAKLGRGLDTSISAFNNAISSFETRIMPGARKFNELGITAKKEIDNLSPLEKHPRQFALTENDKTNTDSNHS